MPSTTITCKPDYESDFNWWFTERLIGMTEDEMGFDVRLDKSQELFDDFSPVYHKCLEMFEQGHLIIAERSKNGDVSFFYRN